MNFAARLISWVFHPLLMPTLLFALILAFEPSLLLPLRPGWSILLLIVGMTFGLPAVNFVFFRVTGSLRNLTMPQRQERVMPFIFIAILYIFLTGLFYYKIHILSLVRIMAIMSVMVTLSAIITIFYKISVHAIAGAGLPGMLLGMMVVTGSANLLGAFVFSLVVAGGVMSARLQLNAHTPDEVGWGAGVGAVVGFAGVWLAF